MIIIIISYQLTWGGYEIVCIISVHIFLSFIIFLDLLELSDCYCESELKKKCELLLKRTVSVENAIALYTIALRYQAKVMYMYTVYCTCT